MIAIKIIVKKYHCRFCSIYITHKIEQETIYNNTHNISHGYTTEEKNIYDVGYLCRKCYHKHKNLSLTNLIKIKKYIKHYIHINPYNSFFLNHLKLNKKINKEVVEHVFHPNKVFKRLNDDCEDYLD